MTWEAWTVSLIVVGALVALMKGKFSPDRVLFTSLAILAPLHALSTRFPSPADLASGFGNQNLLAIGVLFVVATGLTETGGLAMLVDPLFGRPKTDRSAQLRMMPAVMAISAFMNNTPVVAVFVPMIRRWCKTANLDPAKLYIPLSYSAVLGGVCTVIGTSTTLAVQGLLAENKLPTMKLFTISVVGVPVALVGLAFVLITSRWLLPQRRRPLSESRANVREYSVEMMVEPQSFFDGKTIEDAGLRHLQGLYLAEIEREGSLFVAVSPGRLLRGNDRLIFVGNADSVVELQRMRGLRPATEQVFRLSEPRSSRAMVEAVISQTCPLVGRSIRAGRFRSLYNAVVIAVHRNGQRLQGKIGDFVLQGGDTLLLEAHPGFAERHRDNGDFLLCYELIDSQPVRYEKAWIALAILTGFVAVIAMEPVLRISLFAASLMAAVLMVVTHCCSTTQAWRSVPWPILVTIGAAYGIGRALETSGVANFLGYQMVELCEPGGALALVAGTYICTLLLTELVTNTAAAVLMFPIAKAVALKMEFAMMPFAVAIAVAASTGFATPMGYQTHLMVLGPGNYKFSDFVRIGLPLDFLVAAVAITITYVVFFPH